MNLFLYANTRNKRKRKKVGSITADFGLVQIAGNLFIGPVREKEMKELKHALSAIFNAKTDVLIISPLCSNCIERIRRNNKTLRQIDIDRFEKDFEVY